MIYHNISYVYTWISLHVKIIETGFRTGLSWY